MRDDLKLLIITVATMYNARLSQVLPEAPVVVSRAQLPGFERLYLPLASHQRLEDGVAAAVKRLLPSSRDLAAVPAGRGGRSIGCWSD